MTLKEMVLDALLQPCTCALWIGALIAGIWVGAKRG